MINIEMVLPEFSRMVHFCTQENKTKPRVIFCEEAFNDEENELLGSALKYCSLKHISVSIIGNESAETDAEVDATQYSIFDVAELGKKVKKLAKKHKAVLLESEYFRICENCGITIEEMNKSRDAVTFTREAKNQKYYTKKDGVEKTLSLSMKEVKSIVNKRK